MRDVQFMRKVFELAKRGGYRVSPNPLVGAILVKNKRIIVKGWHKCFGGDHAEINLLKNARKNHINVNRSTMYINLEPCVHYGKTPPCVPKIIEAGVKRVVVAIKDPNPLVCGRGIAALKSAGIKVDVGCLQKEAECLNKKFIKWIATGMPFIAIKVAMSLDGKIATRTGDSKWITSFTAREYVKRLRDNYDAILVGANTVLADNPSLAGLKHEPKRIILDSSLRIPLKSKVFRDKNVFVATTRKAPKSKIKILQKHGIDLKIFNGEKIPLNPLLRFLASKNISSVLVEGGAEIFGSAIDEKLVDKFYWFIAPKIIGGKNAKTAVAGQGAAKLLQAINLANCNYGQVGEDLFVEAFSS